MGGLTMNLRYSCFYAILFAFIFMMSPSKGGCEITASVSPEITWEEDSEWYGDYLYTIKTRTSCSVVFTRGPDRLLIEDVCNTSYYHLIGMSEETQILTKVSDLFPTSNRMKINLGFYLIMVEDEGV
jgi:hypothetical protein